MKYLLLVCLAISVSACSATTKQSIHRTSTADMDFETINHLVIDCNLAEKQYNWLEEQRSTKVKTWGIRLYQNVIKSNNHGDCDS